MSGRPVRFYGNKSARPSLHSTLHENRKEEHVHVKGIWPVICHSRKQIMFIRCYFIKLTFLYLILNNVLLLKDITIRTQFLLKINYPKISTSLHIQGAYFLFMTTFENYLKRLEREYMFALIIIIFIQQYKYLKRERSFVL